MRAVTAREGPTGLRDCVRRLPAQPGVYRFRDANGRALYVGRAVDLRRRVDSYWGALRDRRHLRRMVPRIARVEAVVCDSGHEAAWLERNLLEHRKPYWNRSRGGEEVPVWVRLDPAARSGGLTIVHEHETAAQARLFGPYLGGAKVRLAVSALDRVLPLAYTGDGLGGFARDMARVLGLGATPRTVLVAAITATLDRTPSIVDVVRAELLRRRDVAAAALAFELAARVHDELEALNWITSEQKVTSSTADDADACGWADGILVRFEIRGGRLRTWTQSECAGPAAARHLAGTPPAWRPFVQRAATLAAQLHARLPHRPRPRRPAPAPPPPRSCPAPAPPAPPPLLARTPRYTETVSKLSGQTPGARSADGASDCPGAAAEADEQPDQSDDDEQGEPGPDAADAEPQTVGQPDRGEEEP